MRSQGKNPAYDRFANILPKSGRYPAKFVDIFWNTGGSDHKIMDVEVVFIPRNLPNLAKNMQFWNEYGSYVQYWQSSLGNSIHDWLQPNGDTPERIFGHLLGTGFVNDAEFARALEEFAHIEECVWAREMLSGYRLSR